MLKGQKNRHTFPKLAIYIMLMLLAMILASVFISSHISSSAIRSETRNANFLFLNKLSKIIDSETEHINVSLVNFCRENLNNEKIGVDMEDVYERHLLCMKISDLIENKSFINSVNIYLNNGEDVLYQSPSRIEWLKASDFFDSHVYQEFINRNKLSSIFGVREIKPDYNSNTTIDRSERVVSFVKRIPTNSLKTSDIAVFNINADYLNQLAESGFIPMESRVLILDENGNIFLSYDQSTGKEVKFGNKVIDSLRMSTEGMYESNRFLNMDIDDELCYVTALKAENDMAYILIVPESIILRPVMVVNMTLLVLAACLLGLGIVISTLIDRKFFQPVLRILGDLNVNKTDAGENEFKRIESYINDIVSKNKEQEKMLESNFKLYRERVIQIFMNGGKQAAEMLNDEKILFNKSIVCFSVILLQLGAEDSTAWAVADEFAVMDAFANQLLPLLGNLGHADKIRLTKRKTAFLLGMETIKSDTDIKAYVQEFVPARISGCTITIGKICSSMVEIKESLASAEKILQCVKANNGAFVFVTADLKNIKADRSGEAVKSSFQTRTGNVYSIDNKELIEKVIGFIKKHYMEDIGLNTIADYVYLCPSYMGKIFRDVSGYSFTDYLIKVRMEAAAQLILSSNKSLSEIMEKVGYCSIQGFSRVFKNYYKCSPGEYRKKAACTFLQLNERRT